LKLGRYEGMACVTCYRLVDASSGAWHQNTCISTMSNSTQTPRPYGSRVPHERSGRGYARRPKTAELTTRGSLVNRAMSGTQQQGHVKRRAGCEQFVLFNTGAARICDIWEELRAILTPEMLECIISLQKVNTPNRPSRVDLYVTKAAAAGLIRSIRTMTMERTPKFVSATKEMLNPEVRWRSRVCSLWRIDVFKVWRDRQTKIIIDTSSMSVVPRYSFSTLNVNGLAAKKIDLCEFLENESIGICALQETLVSARAYQVQIPGYTSYTQNWTQGFRGQSVLVHQSLSSYEVERKDGQFIHIKVNGIPNTKGPIHIIAVYMPSGGNFRGERSKRVKEILALNRSILGKTPGTAVVILGDWNMDCGDLSGKLRSEITGLRVLRTRGSPLSRFPVHQKPRAIDHIVGNSGAYAMLRPPRVFRNYEFSDHKPLIANVRVVPHQAMPPTPLQWTYDTDAIKRYAREIVHDNKWSALNVDEICDTDSLEVATTNFVQTMDDVTKLHNVKKPRSCGGPPLLPRKLIDMLKRRDSAAKKVSDKIMNGQKPSAGSLKRLRCTNDAFSKAKIQWEKKQQQSAVKYTCRDIRGCDLKKVWARLKSMIEHDSNANTLTPVRNKDGKLCVTDEEILTAIADHYDQLANENPGPSQDSNHWAQIDLGVPRGDMNGINDDIRWQEVLLSIRRMNRNTAVGCDGVHINILKELLNEECMAHVLRSNEGMRRPEQVRFALGEDDLPYTPLTPLGKTFYQILCGIWKTETPPDQWNEVYICSLFKSGDPELMVNYRGISLISVGFKVLLGVMADRLYVGCESAKLIVPEQAGFRRHEEAVAQFIAVAEIARRRHIEEKTTYAIFVDFKKAFDKVHHEALYRILEHMGVRGTALALIKAMYRNSRMRVRAGGRLTTSFGMLRGNRQGCPLSPLLFIIFVNHLLEYCTAGGVDVPGIIKREKGNVCTGGQYADDLVGLESTQDKAQIFCNNVYKWGEIWGMEMGVTKCGILLWSDDEEEHKAFESYVFTIPDAAKSTIDKVDGYKYLGIVMDPTLPNNRSEGGNEIEFCKSQALKGEAVLATIRPRLCDPKWPLLAKTMLIRTLLMSKMTFGSEWVGYKVLHAAPLQRVVNKAMRLALGNSSKSKIHDSHVASFELGLPSIRNEQAGLRARLSAKLQFTDKIKTWLKDLQVEPFKSRSLTWVTTNRRWEAATLSKLEKYEGLPNRPWVQRGRTYEVHTRCNAYRNEAIDLLQVAQTSVDRRGFYVEGTPEGLTRYARGFVPLEYDPVAERELQIAGTLDYQSKNQSEWNHIMGIRDCELEAEMSTWKGPAWDFYDNYAIGATRGYLRAALCYPELTEGVNWLFRVRTRSFPRVQDRWQVITRSGQKPTFEKNRCPLKDCGALIEQGWEWEHLMVSCDNLGVQAARAKHLARPIAELKAQLMDRVDIFDDQPNPFVEYRRPTRWVLTSRAIAVHLIGGVVNNDYDVDYHLGFGQLDRLPSGLNQNGYVYVAQFLADCRVVKEYLSAVFMDGDYLYKNRDELSSVYTPTPGRAPHDWSPASSLQSTPRKRDGI
jgi:hypothetical protein